MQHHLISSAMATERQRDLLETRAGSVRHRRRVRLPRPSLARWRRGGAQVALEPCREC